ncbi:MAG: OmpA family protein [Ramlibacter sp.]
MVFRFIFVVAALALTGCAQTVVQPEGPGPAARATGLLPQDQRITDLRIAADRKVMSEIQLRLRRLNEAGLSQNNYPLAKAQCWLDTAWSQYHENDRTGYIEESLAESLKIVQALEADKTVKVGYDTPLVARSTRLRDDLWGQLNALKMRESTLVCNARTVACGEVRLVRAGHAEQQTGWRQANAHVMMAEDAVRRASAEAANCQPALAAASRPAVVAAATPAVSAPAAAVAAVPAAGAMQQPAGRETFTVLADALFKFDKSGRDEMLPGGMQRLALVAERLKRYRTIQSLTVVGYTDRIGGDEYNEKLAMSRAQTVKAYLESLGVKAVNVQVKGLGKRESLTAAACSDKQLGREELVQCLQADRRVMIEVVGSAS